MTQVNGFYGILDAHAVVEQSDFERHSLRAVQIPATGAWIGSGHGKPFVALAANDGARCLLFHGAIHNHTALLLDLGLAPGASLREVLLHAWLRWPNDWIGRLDGFYAIAHWTGEGRDLTLWRDASGMASLFYTRTVSGCLAVSSHLDTLLRLPGVERRLSPAGVHEYLHFLDITPPNTIYENIRAVPPGEGLILNACGAPAETVLPQPTPAAVQVPFEAAVDTAERLLAASIERRLAGVTRPAAFLSGGIDSTLVCTLGAAQRPELESLTVGFDVDGYDEAPVAERVAAYLGLSRHVLRFSRKDILRAVAEGGAQAEQPMADPAAPVTLLAFEHARQHYDMALDGTGADEQMGAMPPRHVRLATGQAARLPVGIRRWAVRALKRVPCFEGYAPILDFEHPADMLARWKGFSRKEIEILCGQPVHLENTRFFRLYAQFPRNAHFDRYSALLSSMPSDRLSQGALITGLDLRLPFCSPEVDNFLRGLPQAYRWQEGAPKRILRALLARHVPQELWDAPKRGFNFPLIEFLSDGDSEVVRRYLLHGQWERWQVLAPERVAEYARRFISGERQLGFRVWALVVLAAWLEGHEP